MRLFWNECKKILFRRTTLLLLLLLCAADGVLLHTSVKRTGGLYIADAYRGLYQEMDGWTLEEAVAYIEENTPQGENRFDDFRKYELMRTVGAEVKSSASYREYLDGIAESARVLDTLSIFQKKDDFSNRNIRKLAKVYGDIPEITPSFGPAKGIELALGYSGTDLLALLFVVWIIFSTVVRERELGQMLLTKTTYRGHGSHAAGKLAVCGLASVLAVVCLELVNLGLAWRIYGLGDLGRPIQSVPKYRACIFPLAVWQFVLLVLLLKILSVLCIAAVSFWAAAAGRTYVKLALVYLGVFGVEGLCFVAIRGNSSLCLLKYVNLLAGFDADWLVGDCYNLNLFGYPLWYLPVFLCALALCTAISVWLGVRAYARVPALPLERRAWKRRFVLFPEKTRAIFLQEAYKLFVCEKVVWILLAAVVFAVVSYQPMREFFSSPEDMYYKQYMLKLEGMYSDEKEGELEAERETYRRLMEQMQQAIRENPDAATLIGMKFQEETKQYTVLPRVEAHAEYLKEKGGAFLYDSGYRILVNDEIGKADNNSLAVWVNLLMVLCTGFLFSSDRQSGMAGLLRATGKGRKPLIARKILLGTLVLTGIFALVYVPFVHNVLGTYGVRGLDFPACSLECLSGWGTWLSLRGYLILLFVARYLFLWVKMNFLFWLSTKVKSNGYTIIIGAGLYVGPLLLYYL